MVTVWGSGEVDSIGVYVVRPCLTSLGLVESVHGHHSTKLIGHPPLINHYEPTF